MKGHIDSCWKETTKCDIKKKGHMRWSTRERKTNETK